MTTTPILALPPSTQTLTIQSGHKLTAKTSRCLSALSTPTGAIALAALAPAAQKAISIAEITKRQCKHKCYQYNIITSEMIDVPAAPPHDANDGEDDPFVARPERKRVTKLTIVISREHVGELAERYGEQTGEGADNS